MLKFSLQSYGMVINLQILFYHFLSFYDKNGQLIFLILSNLLLCRRNIFPSKGNSVHYSIKYISHKDSRGAVKVSN